jgi:hypothetical protein
LAHAILNRLDLAAQHRQWSAQLVGDVRHPLPARLFVLLQGQGQGIEILRQPPQFVGRGHGHPRGVFPGCQAAGGGGKGADRTNQAARQRQGQKGGDHKGDSGDKSQRQLLLLDEAQLKGVGEPLSGSQSEIADHLPLMPKGLQIRLCSDTGVSRNRPPVVVQEQYSRLEAMGQMRRQPLTLGQEPGSFLPLQPALHPLQALGGNPPFRQGPERQPEQVSRIRPQEIPAPPLREGLLHLLGQPLQPLLLHGVHIPQEAPVDAPLHDEKHPQGDQCRGGQQGGKEAVLDPDLHFVSFRLELCNLSFASSY